MAINAVYNLYDGSAWVEYHFTTNASQVSMTTGTGWRKFVSAKVKVNGQAFAEGSENGSAEVTINGSHINWFNGTKPTTNYLVNAATIQAALQALDTAAKSAYDHVPTGSVTYGDGGAFGTLFPDLYAIEQLSGTSGLLKKTAANTWALDTTTYVPTSRTINGKSLGSDVTLAASDIGYSNSAFVLANDVATYLDTLTNVAQGKQNSYAISDAATGTDVINTQFATQSSVSINVTFTVGVGGVTSDKKIKLSDGTTVDVARLKVGDNVFITETNVPDRWVSGITYPSGGGVGSITFSVLETQKVDLSNYPTKGTTLAHYGIADAKISGNTITLGSDSITVITDISGKAPNNHASNATTYGLGTSSLYGHVKLVSGDLNGKTAADGMAASQSHTHSQYLTSHQSLAEYPKIVISSSTPSGTFKQGDIWIKA